MNFERPLTPDPYDLLPPVPSFILHSTDLLDGARMPDIHTADGGNESPQLSWEGFPDATEGFVLTCFDPDAPTPSGYWHWTVIDLDSSITSLERGAGQSDLTLPAAATHIRSDGNSFSYEGAAPPLGDRDHRYIFAIHALDVPTFESDPEESTPAGIAFQTFFHTIARARLTVTYGR